MDFLVQYVQYSTCTVQYIKIDLNEQNVQYCIYSVRGFACKKQWRTGFASLNICTLHIGMHIGTNIRWHEH